MGQLNPAWVEAAFDRGDLCHATFIRGEIVGYGWTSFVRCPHIDDIWVEFARTYRYGYKGFTRASHRGQGVSGGMYGFTDARCMEAGCRRTISFVEMHNYSSLRDSYKHGNQRVGFAGYVRLFGRVFPFRSPGAKKHTFRFSAGETLN